MRYSLVATGALLGMALAGPASASLSVLNCFTGQVDVSTDGCGSTTEACTLTVNAPIGAVVQAAYLYTATHFGVLPSTLGGSFNGNAIAGYTNLGSTGGGAALEAGRLDVTAAVAGVINGGAGGAYNFNYTESSANQSGGALVVVYSAASLATTTIGILDGVSATTGDSTFINFVNPLAPSAPGFRAEMRLGINHSFDGVDPQNPTGTGQVSQVTVNGSPLTNVAGHCDDAIDAGCDHGNLITVGDDADPGQSLELM